MLADAVALFFTPQAVPLMVADMVLDLAAGGGVTGVGAGAGSFSFSFLQDNVPHRRTIIDKFLIESIVSFWSIV